MDVVTKPEGIEAEYLAQFLKIQQIFITGLAQRMHDIQQAPDAQSRHVALHRLAGAAGGYGFSELSLLAREAMDAESGAEELMQAALQRLSKAINAVRPAS